MIEIKIEGLKALTDSMKTLADKANEEITDAVNKGAALVVSSAKVLCPREFNILASSITYEIIKDVQGVNAKIGTNVKYAPYVEYGTGVRGGPYPASASIYKGQKKIKGQKSQAYLYPALQQNFSRINTLIAEAVQRVMKR